MVLYDQIETVLKIFKCPSYENVTVTYLYPSLNCFKVLNFLLYGFFLSKHLEQTLESRHAYNRA